MATIEKGKVFKAAEVIDYTNGGVVSKEFIHSNAGTVTLFSFDAGQGLSEHTAPFDALIQDRFSTLKRVKHSSFQVVLITRLKLKSALR